MWIFRVLSSAIFLLSIILSIPIAFDVGGRECGLAFSLSLFSFYIFYSGLKLATPDDSRIRWALVQMIGMAQWVLLPGLLIWSMNRFAVDANNSGDWVARTFDGKRAQHSSVTEWIFGSGGLLEILTVGAWDKLLRYSTPFFQLAEGFCSLLVIQAAGQITRWLVNRGRSDTWMVCGPCYSPFHGAEFHRSVSSSCRPRSYPARSISFGGSRISRKSAMWMQL